MFLPNTGQVTARDVGDETGRSLETIIAMEESQSLGQDRSRWPSNVEALQNVGDEQDGDPRDRASLESYKRFLLKGGEEFADRADAENLLARSYQADESSGDQLQELI